MKLQTHSAPVITLVMILVVTGCRTLLAQSADDSLRNEVQAALRKAAMYYHSEVASHGGYVYYYSLDLRQRWGEGPATADQIWVQPPGTPTVGLAYLAAYEATGDAAYVSAARDAGKALVYGQLVSGGWTNVIDFDVKGARVARYRHSGGSKNGTNHSSLDDGQSQSALRLLMHLDRATHFADAEIHAAALAALDALLAAQFPIGAFPQSWTGSAAEHPVISASYPDYDWRTEGRIKNYWDMYTLNDNVAGNVAEALIVAIEIYDDDRCRTALRKLGGFLRRAQMPAPQPGWAQQYNYGMQPIGARKFEPPALASDETQEALATLLQIHRVTGEPRYLEPFPAALEWLRRSQLHDGRLARFYELGTNRPLYMQRRGSTYHLTYDDANLPDHYGWKISARWESLQRKYEQARAGTAPAPEPLPSARQVRLIVNALDREGRWVSTYDGERLAGQPEFARGMSYLSSEVFSRNVTTLSRYLGTADK